MQLLKLLSPDIKIMRASPTLVKQATKTWCGPACICSVLGLPNDMNGQWDVAGQMCCGNQVGVDTTTLKGFQQYFDQCGCLYNLLTKPTVSDLERLPDNFKIIALLHLDEVGHSVVYWRLDNNHVCYMDPKDGAIHRAPPHDFEGHIDVCICINT